MKNNKEVINFPKTGGSRIKCCIDCIYLDLNRMESFGNYWCKRRWQYCSKWDRICDCFCGTEKIGNCETIKEQLILPDQ